MTVFSSNEGEESSSWGTATWTGGFTAWANGQTISIGDRRTNASKLYFAATAGTTATGSEPVHTSGTVAGADTIQWTYENLASEPGTGTWGGTTEQQVEWRQVEGIGNAISLLVGGEFKDVDLQYLATLIDYKKGGIL